MDEELKYLRLKCTLYEAALNKLPDAIRIVNRKADASQSTFIGLSALAGTTSAPTTAATKCSPPLMLVFTPQVMFENAAWKKDERMSPISPTMQVDLSTSYSNLSFKQLSRPSAASSITSNSNSTESHEETTEAPTRVVDLCNGLGELTWKQLDAYRLLHRTLDATPHMV